MKNLYRVIPCILLFLIPWNAGAQVSSLVVNGSPVSFSITSGDFVSWNYNIPTGATAIAEVWIDVDADHAINPTADRRLFLFTQIDGDTVGNNGPPDMDGVADGNIEFLLRLGLAPESYVLRFTHDGVGQSVWGTVAPLAIPSYIISGTVSGPAGFDLSYIPVEASASGGNSVEFWHGLTDSAGDYTIAIGPDTSGNPWEIGISEIPPPHSADPRDTTMTLEGNITGLDFAILGVAVDVYGYLIDDAGDTLRFTEIYISRDDSLGGNTQHYMRTDDAGKFWFGIPLAELDGHDWRLAMPWLDDPPSTHMLGVSRLSGLTNGDSLKRDLRTYVINSTISGFLQVDGSPPGGSIRVFASDEDSAESFGWSDPVTGAFTIPVSDNISEYDILVRDVFGPYFMPTVTAEAGATGVIVNMTTTGAEEGGTLPSGYSLGQNYPNPFNPSTTIPYSIPAAGEVTLALYDVLGRQVALLVDGVQDPGAKTVAFDATLLPSGVYQYRITAGTFTAVRKLLIMK